MDALIHARYDLEHKLLPQFLFSDTGPELISTLLKERGKFFVDALTIIGKEYGVSCPYKEDEYVFKPQIIVAHENVPEIVFLSIDMPTPEFATLCARIYICFDSSLSNIRYYTVEKSFPDFQMLCGWDEDSIHANYGRAPESDEDLFSKIYELYCEYWKRSHIQPESDDFTVEESNPKEPDYSTLLVSLFNNPCLLDGFCVADDCWLVKHYFFTYNNELYFADPFETNKAKATLIYSVKLKKNRESFCFAEKDARFFDSPITLSMSLVKMADLKILKPLAVFNTQFRSTREYRLKTFDHDSLALYDSTFDYLHTNSNNGENYKKTTGLNSFPELMSANPETNCPICGAVLKNGKCPFKCSKLIF